MAETKTKTASKADKAEGGANPNDPVTKAVTIPNAVTADAQDVKPLIETDGMTPAEADRTHPPLTDAEAQAQAGATPPERVEPIARPDYSDVDRDSDKDFKRIAQDAVNEFARGLLVRELRRNDTQLRQQIGYGLGYGVDGVHQVRLEVVEGDKGDITVKARHRSDGKWIDINVD